jgi:hypothetical protein
MYWCTEILRSWKPFLNQLEANFRIMFVNMILCNYKQSIKNESAKQWVILYECSDSVSLTHHTHTYCEVNVLDVKDFSITVYKSCSDLTVLTHKSYNTWSLKLNWRCALTAQCQVLQRTLWTTHVPTIF